MISLVIPIRNASSHLKNCLDTVLEEQKKGEISEVICVDDASEDNSKKILEAYPFKILDSKGYGASAARNTGIKNASNDREIWTDKRDLAQETKYGNILMVLLGVATMNNLE